MAEHSNGPGEWRKSSSSDTNECVEIRFRGGVTQVRNSRDRGGPVFTFDAPEWAAFLAGIRAGEFER